MRKLIFILFIGCLAAPIYAQENWGPATHYVTDGWEEFYPFRTYGFSYPCISSNDSLLFLYYNCVDTSGIASSVYLNGEWQMPEQIQIEAGNFSPEPLFFFDQNDTLLYFTAGLPGGYGDFDIWAARLVNGAWGYPFNLGLQINTAGEENSPSMPDDASGLYFTRNDTIMYSEIVNGQFTEPVVLPPAINSELAESHLRISRDGLRLYFNRAVTLMNPDSMFVSYFINGSWQIPVPMNSNINFVSYNPNCPMVQGDSFAPSFSLGGAKMYFTRFFVYGEFCEPGWDILVSELITEIETTPGTTPSAFSISAYPNPFNSQTNISIDGDLETVSEITIYDITGRRIKSFYPALRITWDGTDDRGTPVSSGIYFVKATSGNSNQSLKITYLR
jgi:hypothetical protein